MPTKCIIDGSENKKKETETIIGKRKIDLVRCQECGLLYADLPDKELDKILYELYQHDFWDKWVERKTHIRFRKIREAISRFLKLYYVMEDGRYRFLLKNGIDAYTKIMDIGCAEGKFLFYMKYMGYDIDGMEPDQNMVEKAEKIVPGSLVFKGVVEDIIEHPGLIDDYDVISMIHVIEHLVRPQILKDLNAKYLFLEVPNIDNAGRYDESIKAAHIYHFNKKTLTKFLELIGYEIIDIEEFGPNEKCYFKDHILKPLLWRLYNIDASPPLKNGRSIRVLARKRGGN